MPETPDNQQQQILHLTTENHRLKASCAQLEELRTSMEEAICDSNTKLLHAEMTSLELEQVFSACTDALWVIREDGVVVRANAAMLLILGKTSATEVIGKQCSELLDYYLCRDEGCPLKRLRSNTRCEYDIQLVTTGVDSEHFILTTAPLITLAGAPGIVGQFKNITARKVAEKELATANAALKRMTMIDGLTQIANRRCFDETLLKEWKRLSRNRLPLSLLMGDIDFFKKYNDHYGHQAGDECLRQVGKTLAGAVMRPADLAARYGGEEFVILLPEIDLQGALCVGNRILAALENLGIQHQLSSVNKSVTMSMGAASLTPNLSQDCNHLVKLADEALYQAKNAGRNRIIANAQE
ncbi:MAG: diguanylate cyclase [Desulfobulbaceae bacterium]|nr:diguanylate cyclase [Desulfobulbaceae bacterium]